MPIVLDNDQEIDESVIDPGAAQAMGNMPAATNENVHIGARRKKEIDYPDIIFLDELLRNRYGSYMVAAINEKLAEDEMSGIVRAPVVTSHVSQKDCDFTGFSFWRMNQSNVLADVDAQVMLKIADEETERPFTLYISLWISIDDDIQCDLYDIGSVMDKPSRDAWKLDHHMIPILGNDNIDDASELVWNERHKIAMKDPDQRKPEILAQQYGLKIRPMRLAQCIEQEYLLFLDKGTVLIQEECEPGTRRLPPPREVPVEAKTIVLNTSIPSWDNGEMAVYAACFQYEWYYMFYRLNQLCSTDLSRVGMKKILVSEDRQPTSPLTFIGIMTDKGAFGLMMPHSVMTGKVQAEFQKAGVDPTAGGLYNNHSGWRYDRVIRTIADEFGVRKFRVRQWLVKNGRTEAKGALNFDSESRRYYPPFGFSSKETEIDDEFYISRRGLFALYNSNGAFRELMRTGDYAFVDGLVCVNDTEAIARRGGAFHLQAIANESVHRYCLRFGKTYEGKKAVFGFDHDAYKKYASVINRHSVMTENDRFAFREKVLRQIPDSFTGALDYLMRSGITGPDTLNGKMSDVMLAVTSGVSDETIIRYHTDPKAIRTADELLAICIGLNLPPWLSDVLFERANMKIDRTGPFSYYGFILDCLYLNVMDTVKKFIANAHFNELELR